MLQEEIYDIFNYQCETCGGDGCMICDPVTPEKCFICETGYHMDLSGSCIDDTPDDNTDDTTVVSEHILHHMFVLFLAVLISLN
jgi:hypothetical protein